MQLFDLTGKTALITGASQGLGEHIARVLHNAGARVILAARNLSRLKGVASDLQNAFVLEMDVADLSCVQKAFKQLEAQGERLEICVNNAGIAKMTPLFESDTQSDFEQIIKTNIMGVWYVTQAAAIHMQQHQIQGSIINIGSINGDTSPAKGATAYNISKAAVIHMTKSLMAELSPYQIRINTISPGFFPTEAMVKANGEEVVQKVFQNIPLGITPALADIGGAILYFASNKASRYVTGSLMTVDGGMSWKERL